MNGAKVSFLKDVGWLPAALSVVGAVSALLMVSCGVDHGAGSKPSAASVKANYVKMAHAMYSDSLSAAQTLQTAITGFLAAPTESNLSVAKAAYKTLRMPYQQSEVLRWDTDITLGSNTGVTGISSVDDWEGQVNAWPLAEGLIDYTSEAGSNIIAGDDAITAEFLIAQNGLNDNEANVATGIHAIEFLLWGQDLNGTGAGAGARPATDYDLNNCTGGNCDRRATYLTVVTQLLVDDLTDMVAEWSPSAASTDGTLAYNFLNSDNGLAYILGSMKVLADDELAAARMGTALETGDTEEEHDCFSDLSHVAIYHNFQGIKNAFYGKYTSPIGGTNVSGDSIGDLLRAASPSAYNEIDMSLIDIESRMAAILALGESDTLRFDQIIGLSEGDAEWDNVNAASLALVQLGLEIDLAREALSLNALNTDGGGDGD